MGTTAHKLLIKGYAFFAQGTVWRSVRREVAAHEAENRLATQIDGRAAPEAADPDDFGADLLHEVHQQVDRRSGRDEVFDQQHARLGPEQPLELDGQRDFPVSADEAFGPGHQPRRRWDLSWEP